MTRGAIAKPEARGAAAYCAGDWLGLAAAPSFALMAVLTGIFGLDAQTMLCPASQGGAALGGMVPMYLLMSIFHSGIWLRLFSKERHRLRRLPVMAG